MTEEELKELDDAFNSIGIVSNGADFTYREMGRHSFSFIHNKQKFTLKLTKNAKRNNIGSSRRNKSGK
jgi:hypothetical protein